MKYVIPSYQRPKILRDKTLHYLVNGHNVSNDEIYLVLRNDDKFKDDYEELGDDYNIIWTDVKGIGRTHNFITDSFDEGEYICEIDDDLIDCIDKDGNSIKDFQQMIEDHRFIMDDQNISYGGFYSTPNPFYMANMKSEHTMDLRYMLGLLRVRKICKDIRLETNYSEDFENCILHYIRDGAILKNNHIAGKTTNYAKGGCNGDGRDFDTEKVDKEFLYNKYPHYCKLFQRKNGRWDLRLKHKKN